MVFWLIFKISKIANIRLVENLFFYSQIAPAYLRKTSVHGPPSIFFIRPKNDSYWARGNISNFVTYVSNDPRLLVYSEHAQRSVFNFANANCQPEIVEKKELTLSNKEKFSLLDFSHRSCPIVERQSRNLLTFFVCIGQLSLLSSVGRK